MEAPQTTRHQEPVTDVGGRRTYKPPQVTVWGAVIELTEGAAATNVDMGGGGANTSSVHTG